MKNWQTELDIWIHRNYLVIYTLVMLIFIIGVIALLSVIAAPAETPQIP